MDQQVIERLNLKETTHVVGLSFANRITIYLWPGIIRGYKTYLSECDDTGNELPDGVITIIVVNKENIIVVIAKTNGSFLLDVDISGIKNIISHLIN